MYLYQPCLLTLSLYAWAFEMPDAKRRWLRVLFPLTVLALSEIELTFTGICIYPASLLLAACFLIRDQRTIQWTEVLTASLLGGLVSGKAADLWPLFTGVIPLCAGILLILVSILCRNREDRLLSYTLAGIFFELFFCLKEYILFSFCVLRLGSGEGLSLAAASACLYSLTEQIRLAPRRKKSHRIYTSN